MAEHLVFLTGKLAEKSLHRVLAEMQAPEFTYEVRQMGISVAALMTADLIRRRLDDVGKASRVVIPGRCRGDIEALSRHFGVPFERGPEELKDLPGYFGKEKKQRDLSLHDVTLFAEIVDAPRLGIEAIIERASQYVKDGADVIDVGCLPDTPFPHLEETVNALKQAGFRVSLDSTQEEELLRGGRAGADYLLSLSEETLWIADQVAATPVLISTVPADIETLYRTMEAMEKKGRPYYADPILEPIHFGFTDSLLRYRAVRARYPEAPMMMGVGNLTELTHADTAGINALLMGIISELRITSILTTEVSEHCRSAVREADRARRILYAAREDGMPPQHIDPGLMALHERKPFPYDPEEIQEMALAIKDKNFRIQVSRAGIHIYNKEGLHAARDPYDLFDYLEVEGDGAHAFYLGLELARAQIAWQLGKRYRQDEELDWGCMVDKAEQDLSRFAPERSTLKARRRFRHRSSGK